MRIFLYLAVIIAANIITAEMAPIAIMGLIIPAGSFLIGVTFILRDLTQMKHGRKITYWAIITGLALSGITAAYLGDGLQIVGASMLAFLVSELIDTEIFTKVKGGIPKRVLHSGIYGGVLDSAIFVVVGLGPIGMGVLSWSQCIYAILGQTIVKVIMQGVGALGILFCMHKIQQPNGDKRH